MRASNHRILLDDFPIERRAEFRRAALGVEVHMIETETFLVAVHPFEIVDQTPQEIAGHGNTHDVDRVMYLRNYLLHLQRATSEVFPWPAISCGV